MTHVYVAALIHFNFHNDRATIMTLKRLKTNHCAGRQVYLEYVLHRDVTFLCQVPVEHQLSMSQVVEHRPEVRGVSVY